MRRTVWAELCAALLGSIAVHVDVGNGVVGRLLLLAVVHGALPAIAATGGDGGGGVHGSAAAAALDGDWLAVSVHAVTATAVAHWAAGASVRATDLVVPPPLTLALWAALCAQFVVFRRRAAATERPTFVVLAAAFNVAAVALDGLVVDPLHILLDAALAWPATRNGVRHLVHTAAALTPTMVALAALAYTMGRDRLLNGVVERMPKLQRDRESDSSSSSGGDDDEDAASYQRALRRRNKARTRRTRGGGVAAVAATLQQHQVPDAGPLRSIGDIARLSMMTAIPGGTVAPPPR